MNSRRDDDRAVVVHDASGRVLACNARAAELMGLAPGASVPGYETPDVIDITGPDGTSIRLRPDVEVLHWPDEVTTLAVVRTYDEEPSRA